MKAPGLIPADLAARLFVDKAPGNTYNIAFGADTAGTWHVVISDTGAPILDDTFNLGPAWDVVAVRKLAKGIHTIAASGVNAATGESCSGVVTLGV